MEELKLNYSKKGKHSPGMKKLFLFAGLVMIGLSIGILAMVFSSDISRVLLIPAIANILVGLHFILTSMEHKILFPKKYIHITDEAIEFKLGGFFKEQRIEWDSISRILDKGKSFHIYSGDKVIKINMLHFPSSDEKRIRERLNHISEQKKQPSPTR